MWAREEFSASTKSSLPAEVPQPLGNEFGTGEIGFSKADDKELIGIRDLISIRVGDSLQEVVIVRDPERMKSRFTCLTSGRNATPSILAGISAPEMRFCVRAERDPGIGSY